MINMKKLIDDTDFDNLNQLTKRWASTQHKPAPSNPSSVIDKQNDFKKSNETPARMEATKDQVVEQMPIAQPKQARKHQVVPQVIDEDTEHFKNKLEHLLNNFKTDAVAEFMSMKKEMLDYQQECVKSDTQKYLTMYQDKHKELLETKQKLLEVSRLAQKKTLQVELLSEHVAKLNQRMQVYKFVSRPFSVWYEYTVEQKQMKYKMKEAERSDNRRLKRKALAGWAGVHKQEKDERTKVQNEERIEKEVAEIVGRFQKQMELLKLRLAESLQKNQQYENNKHMLQENLKKAFLRGVCAMNMEAMGVLGSQNVEQSDWATEKQKTDRERSVVVNNMSYVDPRVPGQAHLTQNQSMYTPSVNNNLSQSAITRNQNTVIAQKSQSKNHKWREAPIMGVEQPREREQPQMQVVRPTTEGKVIKVVDGRSAVEPKKTTVVNTANKSSFTNSRKNI